MLCTPYGVLLQMKMYFNSYRCHYPLVNSRRYITSLDGVKRLQTVRLVDLSTVQQEGEGLLLQQQQQDTPTNHDISRDAS